MYPETSDEIVAANICFKCGKAARFQCLKCDKYFCENCGNTDEDRCEKCDENYCF